MGRMEDLTGKRFGKLVVISFLGIREDNHYIWECKCDCGKIKGVSRNRLTCSYKPSRSCGCMTINGAIAKTIHGFYNKSVYRIWSLMKQRCYNKNNPGYKNYGGRGIKVCKRWLKSFENFLADMGNPSNIGRGSKKLSLDRTDNNGNYCKKNCRWVTNTEQLLNKRGTIKLELNGVTKPLKSWCDELGLSYSIARYRHVSGRNVEEVLSNRTVDKRTGTFPKVTDRITYKGETRTIREWAIEYGVENRIITSRLSYGWTVEEILTIPVQKKIRRK